MLSSRRGRWVSPKLDSNCVTPRTYTSVPRFTSANRSSKVFLIVSVNTSVPAISETPSMTTMNVSAVVAEYITAGPIIMRTALRSLVARDIRSPVR